MSFKVNSAAGGADFSGPLSNASVKKPDKNSQAVPLPPLDSPEAQLAPSQLDKSAKLNDKMGRALTPERVHLCMAHAEPNELPKIHQCRVDIAPKDKQLPPKLNQCAFIPEESVPFPKQKRALPPGIYGCKAEKPDLPVIKPKPPGIYQCTAKIEPGKRAPDPGVYQCAFHPPDPGSKNLPGIYACSYRPDQD